MRRPHGGADRAPGAIRCCVRVHARSTTFRACESFACVRTHAYYRDDAPGRSHDARPACGRSALWETRSSLSRGARFRKIDHLSRAARFRKNRSSLARSALWLFVPFLYIEFQIRTQPPDIVLLLLIYYLTTSTYTSFHFGSDSFSRGTQRVLLVLILVLVQHTARDRGSIFPKACCARKMIDFCFKRAAHERINFS